MRSYLLVMRGRDHPRLAVNLAKKTWSLQSGALGAWGWVRYVRMNRIKMNKSENLWTLVKTLSENHLKRRENEFYTSQPVEKTIFSCC